jgi:hypothetical protein
MLTPPGPTSRPTTIRTMPYRPRAAAGGPRLRARTASDLRRVDPHRPRVVPHLLSAYARGHRRSEARARDQVAGRGVDARAALSGVRRVQTAGPQRFVPGIHRRLDGRASWVPPRIKKSCSVIFPDWAAVTPTPHLPVPHRTLHLRRQGLDDRPEHRDCAHQNPRRSHRVVLRHEAGGLNRVSDEKHTIMRQGS